MGTSFETFFLHRFENFAKTQTALIKPGSLVYIAEPLAYLLEPGEVHEEHYNEDSDYFENNNRVDNHIEEGTVVLVTKICWIAERALTQVLYGDKTWWTYSILMDKDFVETGKQDNYWI